MRTEEFVAQSELPATAEDAFAWHSKEGAIDRLIPPWEDVRISHREGGISPGATVELRLQMGPVPIRWMAEHGPMLPKRQFSDRQVSGPFAVWRHLHRFHPKSDGRSVLEDRIEYRVPGRTPGRLLAGPFVRRQLDRMFKYRHATTASDLDLLRRTPMSATSTIAVSGSSGLIGSALIPLLTTAGHSVRRLVRGEADRSQGEIEWRPAEGRLNPADLEGVDAVIHLGGENIASGRWNEEKRKRIRESRVNSTRLVAETIARMERPPRTLLCASAVGYYGDRGNETLSEEADPGRGFLADVCRQWEQAAQPARDASVRVANLRFAMVLSPRDGALKQMLPLFRFGLGGRLGSGKQYWSWIGIDDAIGAIYHVLASEDLSGPVNMTAPEPVTNRQFTSKLGKVLHRPAVIPAPSTALRVAMGSMADEMLLASTRAVPQRLSESGYRFRHPDLESALRHLLGK